MISIETVVQLGTVFTKWGGISGGTSTDTVTYIILNCTIYLVRPASTSCTNCKAINRVLVPLPIANQFLFSNAGLKM